MKKIIVLLLLCLPFIAQAQTDSKYLEGAVPLVDGKVVFSTELQVPAMTKEQIFDALLEWADKRFQQTEKFKSRILFADKNSGGIAINGEEYLVFSSSALSLDRTRIYYMIALNCEDNTCKVAINRIRYWYDENRNGGQRYQAEEWITDEMALNKNKTKLMPIVGKFRRKTIDLTEELFSEMRTALGNKMIALGLKPAPVTPESQVTVVQPASTVQPVATTTPVVTETPAPTATVQTPAAVQAPQATTVEDPTKQATRITLTAGGETLEIGKECWGGKNQLFGKNVTYCIIETQKAMANMLLDQNETYSISFYTAGNHTPALVINCKKMMKQSVQGEEAQKMNSACDADKAYNVYVGEIVE